MADSQTTCVATAGPALFTHDGYRLYVFDGEPRMMDVDIGKRIELAKATNIRTLIEANLADLEFYGLVHFENAPIPQGGRGRGRTKDGTVYYLNQEQVRWIIIQSRTPAGKELARQVLAVFKAWEDGRLVAAGEAAQGTGTAHGARTPTASRQWPGHYSVEHSRFLTAGPPASIPSGFLESVRKDNRFSRIETTLDLTVTVTEDQVRVFDVDLGHAIGGQCTNKVRPRVRELQSQLRLMGPDPWYQISAYQHLGHDYKLTSVFILNHEQAKAIATVLDPAGLTDIHYRLDLLYWHVATGRFSEIVCDPSGLMIATSLDARARRHGAKRHLAPPLRTKPVEPPAHADPFAIITIEQATARAVNPLVEELAEIALLCRSLPDNEAVAALRAELAEIKALLEGQIAAGKEPNHQSIISRLSGLLGRLKGTEA